MARLNNQSSIYNFGAGPACLPEAVLNHIREDIPHWHDGMSIMEISHRLPEFMALTETIEANLRSLLAIPDDFAVLFMAGGARTQFSVIPMNLLNGANTADYIITGHWSNLASKDAAKYCQVHCVASTQSDGFTTVPQDSDLNFSENAPYVHYTDNETIQGVEFGHFPKTEKWLVSDMTSNILTKTIDFSRIGLIYASAQKNLGIAGITVVIVRKSLLGKAHPFTPPTFDYTLCTENHSLMNTPPVFNWYVLGLVLEWVKQQGGLKTLQQEVEQKAKLLYKLIDSSDFYTNPVASNARSRINIPFRLPSEKLDSEFIAQADKAGLKQLKGHKVVGGCRASFYNAMPLSGVQALCDFMRDFEKTHG
ncbi:MAG: 3-phosphoserine/phosphohydroxythreonine transaminase [Candidatus Berkiella sp.]